MKTFEFFIYKNKNDIDKLLCDLYNNYQLIDTLLSYPDKLFIVSKLKSDEHYKNFFVVKIKEETAYILNSFECNVTDVELNEFIDFIFLNYNIKKAEWNIIQNVFPKKSISRPSLIYNRLNDNIAFLPNSYSDYINGLGKQTKKHAKYYVGRLKRDFPSVEYIFKNGKDLSNEEFDKITILATERMSSKKMIYQSNDGILQKGLKHNSGFAFLVKINNIIEAGCIGYILGKHLYLIKIAHNVQYNKYNLGNVVLLKLIELSIEKGISNFHFLWGKNVDYKTRFGGLNVPLYNYYFYRHKDISYFKDYIYFIYKHLTDSISERLKSSKILKKVIRNIRYTIKKNNS